MTSPSSTPERLLEYIRLTRLQTGALTAVTPVLGYLAVMGGAYRLIDALFLFLIGICMHISGFVLNEYTDVEVDRLSPDLANKPLVKGTVSMHAAFLIIISSTAAMYVITLIVFMVPLPLLYLTLAILLSTGYNRYGKRFPGSDTLLAGWAFFFCLFGASIGIGIGNTTGFGVPLTYTLAYLLAMLGFLQVLFNNAVEGGLKDADHDRLGGAKTLATALGVTVDTRKNTLRISGRFKAFAWAVKAVHVLVLTGLLISVWPQLESLGGLAQTILLGFIIAFIVVMLGTLAGFLNATVFDRAVLKRTFSIHEIATYFPVPLALLPVIGVWAAVGLLILPLAWFVGLNLILYQRPLEPRV